MKILLFSTLYPDSTRPGNGIFVETRLRHLLEGKNIDCKVVAPVPWFPFSNEKFGEYSRFALVPRREIWRGVDVVHPRYPLIPKIGMSVAPLLMALAVKRSLRELINKGYNFDIIDAHYFYPDGIAATILGKIFNKPVIITARGTDLNLIPKYPLPRKMIQWAATEASQLVTVCQALKDVLIKLGAPEEKISVLRNGVDLSLFSPARDRSRIRNKLKVHGKTILSVGYLVERKGHDLVIRTLVSLPDVNLIIIGDGPDRKKLLKLAKEMNVLDRVRILGAMKQDKLKEYYSAVDLLVLASSREGWANVLLESMACGTPVVATNVWGAPEIITAPEAGVLAEKRTVESLSSAIKKVFRNFPERTKTRKYAERFSWEPTTQGQLMLFDKIISMSNK